MENSYFLLGSAVHGKLANSIKVVFGIVCIGIAVFWVFYNDGPSSNSTLWISILFLALFGLYQIWAGSGKAIRYVKIGPQFIIIRQNSLLPPSKHQAGEIEKIEFLALSMVFYLKSGKRVLLRFGTTYHETNEKITDELASFAERNQIPSEYIEEKI